MFRCCKKGAPRRKRGEREMAALNGKGKLTSNEKKTRSALCNEIGCTPSVVSLLQYDTQNTLTFELRKGIDRIEVDEC